MSGFGASVCAVSASTPSPPGSEVRDRQFWKTFGAPFLASDEHYSEVVFWLAGIGRPATGLPIGCCATREPSWSATVVSAVAGIFPVGEPDRSTRPTRRGVAPFGRRTGGMEYFKTT